MSNIFEMRAGDTRVLSVPVLGQDGNAANITGFTITWKVARNEHRETVIEKSTADGIEITNGAGGIFEITLDPADTAGLEGDYYHQARVVDGNGEVFTVVASWMFVRPAL